MSEEKFNSSKKGLRFTKNPELSQYGRSIVVNPFTGKTICIVEGINGAKRYFNSPSGCGKAAPRSKMSSANQNL